MIYRWQSWGNGVQSAFLGQFLSFSSFQSVKVNILLEYMETCVFVVLFLGVPYIQVVTNVLFEKIVQMLRNNPNIIVAVATLPLVCLVHPAIGLGLLLLSHAFHAHSNLCRFVFNFLRVILTCFNCWNIFELGQHTFYVSIMSLLLWALISLQTNMGTYVSYLL